jgi:DNA-binding NarL/FixJ family response regulator
VNGPDIGGACAVRVLIADDHPVVRHGLKQILAVDPELNVVGEAKNGTEALDLARRLPWDVAILDYSMPGRSGIELLKDIKREFPERPVLILSIYPEELHATRVLKAGGAGYINKQSASEELTAAIRKVVNGGKYVSPTFDTISDAQQPPHETLSDREYRVMWLIASGMQIHEIAKEMFVSPSTVSTYRARILKKLSVATNAELVRYAIRHRLIA